MKRITLVLTAFILSGCSVLSDTATDTTITNIPTETMEGSASAESSIEITNEDSAPVFPSNEKIKKEMPDFVPVTKTRDIKYGNLPANINTNYPSGVICEDEESGIMYFCDFGRTNTICKYENGSVETIINQSGQYLNLWDGWLYYICDSENPVYDDRFFVPYTGDIWRYNISTGENEFFYETDAFDLMVSDYGLDFHSGYSYIEENEQYGEMLRFKKDSYRIDFNGEGLQKITEGPMNRVYYGENILVPHDGYYAYYNPDTGVYTDMIRGDARSITQQGDWLTWMISNNVYSLNVVTGEMKYIEDLSSPYGDAVVYGYTWHKGELLISIDGGICKVGNGTVEGWLIGSSKVDYITPAVLMSNGESLYGATDLGVLYRYDFDEISEMYILSVIGE